MIISAKDKLLIHIEEIEHISDPLIAYLNVACNRMPFLLESSLVDGILGRYSIVGSNPEVIVISKNGINKVIKHVNARKRTEMTKGDPFAVLDKELADFGIVDADAISLPFIGGAVGYFSYDLNHQIEKLPSSAIDDLDTPDMIIGLYRSALIMDHVENKSYITSVTSGSTTKHTPQSSGNEPNKSSNYCKPKLSSNMSYIEYEEVIQRAKDYIFEGDIFQANLAQRFATPMQEKPIEIYSRIRKVNPAPFSAFLDYGDFSVLSSSPERFIKVENDHIETRPIKGTRPRLSDPEADNLMIEELIASEKDSAEHVMIVDVQRNDLGRICVPGSIEVPNLMSVESYARVHHLVSTVKGALREDVTTGEILRATFPGGSISGAPKIRAMEIIEELEPHRRGIYTGSIGFISAHGVADLNIVIRTVITKDNIAYFHAGGGIVADSDPQLEYEETTHKASALLTALSID